MVIAGTGFPCFCEAVELNTLVDTMTLYLLLFKMKMHFNQG